MPADDNYNPLYPSNPIGVSRRRLPFDSNSVRMSSSTSTAAAAMKRSVSHPRHEIFLNQSSSSSSMTDENDDDDGEVKMLDETLPENTGLEGSKRKTFSNHHRHQPTMNKDAEKRDRSAPMIEELLQSNMDLKKEIRDIRRQIKHHNGSTKKSVHSQDRTANNRSSKTKIFNGEDEEAMCSFRPAESEYDNEPLENREKIHQYKKEATVYKQQLDACQETIAQLRKTIDTMEKNLGHLKTVERRHGASHQHESSSTASNNNTDHRFIHELFHLCLKSPSRSSKWSTTVPSHHDMKTFIRQTFNELNKSPRKSLQQLNTNSQQETNHFVCKCSDRIHNDHRPSYQYCLTIIEQCQSLFDVLCFTQLPTALNELYYRYGELTNFKRSIASTLSVTENSRLVSCPKLIKILQQLLDDARSNELITFKKMAKISDMNEAVSKIRSYDDFVPYYHQFIEQMANLLEVSKGDEIMPAIKTLKLLAHADSRRPSVSSSQAASQALTRASSMNLFKSPYDDLVEKNLMHSKSLRVLSSSRSNGGESEQPAPSTDNRD